MIINEYGFRTLVIEKPCNLSYGDGNVIVRNDEEYEIPLVQLKSMIVNTGAITITATLLNELSKKNVKVVFCDEKHNPSFEVSGFSENVNSAGRIIDQAQWNIENKLSVWRKIVEQKIANQRRLLQKLGINVPEELLKYENSVLPGDEKNNEGIAARIYFKALFGSEFKRHCKDNINAALNYGYILILSSFNRILTVHGYSTALGIKHSNKLNRFNLSCDLMEPFRPVVDEIVCKNAGKELDFAYKRLLIEALNSKTVKYAGRKLQLSEAFEMYALDVIKSLKKDNLELKELCLD